MFLDERGWVMLIVIYAVTALWKVYLSHRALKRLRQYLLPPAEFGGDMSLATLDRLKTATKADIDGKLRVIYFELGFKIMQVTLPYYRLVWGSTAICSSMIGRVILFVAMDEFLRTSAYFIGTGFHFWYGTSVVYDALRSLAREGAWVFIMSCMFKYFGPWSILLLMFLQTSKMVFEAVSMGLKQKHGLEPLPVNIVWISVETLAKTVGYSIDKIYVDDRHPDPVAIYHSALWQDMITITPQMLMDLDHNQIASVVAHEMGKWRYSHSFYDQSFDFWCFFFKTCFMNATYGSLQITDMFAMGSKVHPIIPQVLALYLFWDPISGFAQGIYNMVKAHRYFIRDDFASSKWNAKSLKEALVKHSDLNHVYFPFYDGKYAAWFYGRPTSMERISKISSRENRPIYLHE